MSHVESAISAIPRERRMKLAATLADCSDPLLKALRMDILAISAREDAEFAGIVEAFMAERSRELREREAMLPALPPYPKETT